MSLYSSRSLAELVISSDYVDLGPDAAYYMWITSFFDLSAAVMLYYDYVLTLPREIEFLWPPHNKQGWFTLAFFLNRYIPIIGVLPIATSYFIPVNPALCDSLHTYHTWLIAAVQMHIGTLCLLRVYALYGRSRRILALLLSVGMGSIVTTLVSFFLVHHYYSGGEAVTVVPTFRGCSRYTQDMEGRFAAIAWAGTLVFDSVIFYLTLYKAFTIGRGVELLNVIVRDGTMYFSALSLMNLGNIMTLLFAPPLLKTSITSYTNVFSIILANRLVLNLRERGVKQLPGTVETMGKFQAALPVSPQLLSMTSVRSLPFVRQNMSSATVTTTLEAVASVPAGESPSQHMDVIGYVMER